MNDPVYNILDTIKNQALLNSMRPGSGRVIAEDYSVKNYADLMTVDGDGNKAIRILLNGGDAVLDNLHITGDLQVDGSFIFGDEAVDVLTVAGYIKGKTGRPVHIGSCASLLGLADVNDLIVCGALEVQGGVYGVDHGLTAGLSDDDHTQYLKLLGRTGGQIAYFGSASGNNGYLYSNPSKDGKIYLGDNSYIDDAVGDGYFKGLAVGTTATSSSNIYSLYNGTVKDRGIISSLVYSGAGQEAIGVYNQTYSTGTHINARGIGGRFEAIDYKLDRTTGTHNTYGGWFTTKDRTGTFQAGATHSNQAGYFTIPNATGDWTTNNPTAINYAVRIGQVPTGYGSNHTYYSIYSAGGLNYFGGALETVSYVKGSYKSSDGSDGISTTINYIKSDGTTIGTLIYKNGLLTSST